jgi:hypothetical protein
LFVFPYGYGTSIADSAVRSRLRCVKGCAAMAAPLHVPAIARTPHGADGPTTVAVLVAVRAARRRHDNLIRARWGTRSPTKLFGNSSRDPVTATLYREPPTMNVRKSDKDSEDQ